MVASNKINSFDNAFVSPSNSSLVSSKQLCQIDYITDYPLNMGTGYYVSLITALIIIALMTVVSNGAFLYIAYRSRRLQTLHSIFLISLSITDLLTGVVVTPLNAILFMFLMNRKYPCLLVWFSMISLEAVSMISFITIALITIEKYLAIIHVFYYERVITKRKLLLMAFVVGVFGTTFSILCHLIGLSYPKTRNTLLLCLNYSGLIFYIAIFYCYGRIFHEIQKVKRRITAENTLENDRTNIKENSNAAKTMAIVIGALTLCYLPSLMDNIWSLSNKRENIPRALDASAKFVAIVTIFLNSALNPIIYYARMSLVRREFKMHFGPGETRREIIMGCLANPMCLAILSKRSSYD